MEVARSDELTSSSIWLLAHAAPLTTGVLTAALAAARTWDQRARFAAPPSQPTRRSMCRPTRPRRRWPTTLRGTPVADTTSRATILHTAVAVVRTEGLAVRAAAEPPKNPIDVLPGDVIYPPLGDKPAKPVLWNPEWPRFSTADWIITGSRRRDHGHRRNHPAAEASTRSAAGSASTTARARRSACRPPRAATSRATASDVILSLEATWPFFVDALITTWWYRGSPDAAAQMALVDGEALAIVTAIQGATNTIVSRERPYGQTCGTPELPNATNDCEGNVRYRSFFSGHSAFTFMAAGLICVHHEKLDLLGRRRRRHRVRDGVRGRGGDGDAARDGRHALRVRRRGRRERRHARRARGSAASTIGASTSRPRRRAAVDWTLIPVGAGLGVGGTF